MSLVGRIAAAICALLATVLLWNYVSVSQPVAARLANDPRNHTVSVWAYHQYGLMPSTLVIDLRRIDGDAAPLDVLRVLFQSAEELQDVDFEKVVLAHNGRARLMLRGEYFRRLGQEFGAQNPIYAMRTLPENVLRLDGSAAYGTWTGGLLGVVTRQMEDLHRFAEDWYLRDVVRNVQQPRESQKADIPKG